MRSISTACSCGGMPSEVMTSNRKRLRTREVLERLGQVGAGDQLVAPAGLREQDPRGAGEVVEHGAGAVGDAPHRVRQVLVEAREEAEAVLGREVLAAAGAGAGHRQAAGLAARDVARLEHHDVEAALGQLVRGGEAGDAAAEDRHLHVHVRRSHELACATAAWWQRVRARVVGEGNAD